MKMKVMFSVEKETFDLIRVGHGAAAIERSIARTLIRHSVMFSVAIINGAIHLLDGDGVVQFTGRIPRLTDQFIMAWDGRDFRLYQDDNGDFAGYAALGADNDLPITALVGFTDEVEFTAR